MDEITTKIGVIVHGPGIIDSGYAKKIIELLEQYGDVTSRLGGTMGRTAVLDAKLEDIIKIDKKLLPSKSIKLLEEDNDVLFLLNSGKSILTGHVFGYKVLSKIDHMPNIIQIERPDQDDGIIIQWNENTDKDLLNKISEDLKLEIIDSTNPTKLAKDNTGYITKNLRVERQVAGVAQGENIMLNGTIIGRADSDKLIIIAEDGKITEMIGGTIKEHGIEKLEYPVDLTKAIIKTGLLRRNDNITPRKINNEKSETAIFLDHAAEDIYKYQDSKLLISIGDDTTLLSSDILYRFNIPIIGITDGDLDAVVLEGFKHPDSLIIQVEHGYDDIIGRKIHEQIFKNKNIIPYTKDIKDQIISLIESENIKYKFVDKQLN